MSVCVVSTLFEKYAKGLEEAEGLKKAKADADALARK